MNNSISVGWPMRNHRGFTLMEIMVVIALVGIISAIAIPNYLAWKPGNIYRGATSKVQRDLNQAKLRPYETRLQCRVVFNATGYQLEDGNQASGSTVWTPTKVETLAEYPGVTITGPGGGPIAFSPVFSPMGTATLGTIVLHYENDTNPRLPARNISINITGRVNIQ